MVWGAVAGSYSPTRKETASRAEPDPEKTRPAMIASDVTVGIPEFASAAPEAVLCGHGSGRAALATEWHHDTMISWLLGSGWKGSRSTHDD